MNSRNDINRGLLLIFIALLLPLSSVAAEPIVATDGQSAIELPVGWQQRPGLHDRAEIEIGATRGDDYLIVLTEAKADFVEMDLKKFSETTTKTIISSLTETSVSPPKKITVNGLPAIQIEISGARENLRLGYLHTAVEGTKNYYQILTWSRKSSFEGGHRKTLEAATMSFREIVK